LWPDYGIDTGDDLIDLADSFGSTAAVTLEIGFGNGENLISMAAGSPQQNFLGIEVHQPGLGHCLLAIKEQQLSNVRLMRDDAVDVLQHRIPDHSLARVNLFFPDPWHKKRHHKRRIVQPPFVELLARKLCPNGIFHVATDWEGYAEHITEIMENSASFITMDGFPPDRIKTRFDQRGSGLGHENWERSYSNCSK
ncbi:MAG: tRNA (guanosine(46)-N7)-methyltransferase TrmB, partial [Gammaproteobacteria bacterium]